MISQADLPELLEELQKIRHFQFDVDVLQNEDSSLTPLAPLMKTQRKRFSFRRGADASAVKKAILKVLKTISPKAASVIGKDSLNIDRIINLGVNPDRFGEFDFDEVAEEAKLNLGDVSESPFIGQMLEIARKYRAIFEGA